MRHSNETYFRNLSNAKNANIDKSLFTVKTRMDLIDLIDINVILAERMNISINIPY